MKFDELVEYILHEMSHANVRDLNTSLHQAQKLGCRVKEVKGGFMIMPPLETIKKAQASEPSVVPQLLIHKTTRGVDELNKYLKNVFVAKIDSLRKQK